MDYDQLEARIAAFLRDPASDAFGALAIDVFRFQATRNQGYSAYCKSLGLVPSELSEWRRIPPAPTDAFKLPDAPFATFDAAQAAVVFRTSGTVGDRRGCHHLLRTTLYDQSIRSAWSSLEMSGLPVFCLHPSPTVQPDSSLAHMLGVLAANDNARFLIDAEGAIDAAPLAAASQPLTLAGTALAFLHLVETNASLTLPQGSWLLETGGYKGSGRQLDKLELYRRLAAHFGVRDGHIANGYSMTELSSQFYAIGPEAPHRAPHWLRARVVDPESGRDVPAGETGHLVLYDLANLGSCIAIQTEDLAIAREDGAFVLIGRDPAALERGCSITADELLAQHRHGHR